MPKKKPKLNNPLKAYMPLTMYQNIFETLGGGGRDRNPSATPLSTKPCMHVRTYVCTYV